MLINIYNEVMLNNIVLGMDNSIKFEFYESETGSDIKSILCKGVSLLKYNSSLSIDEESLPHFVLDVTCEELEKKEVVFHLKNNQYSFFQQDGDPTIYESDSYSLFRIQGGAIDIIVICQEFSQA